MWREILTVPAESGGPTEPFSTIYSAVQSSCFRRTSVRIDRIDGCPDNETLL